jgi:hypothetical protein
MPRFRDFGLVIALVAFALRFAFGLLRHAAPWSQYEFSYLLAADTYTRFRLTDPTLPMQEHIETFHTIIKPTYRCKYPLAQGMVLAYGRVVFGDPRVGVWLSTALACAATCWMLAIWLPRRWALFGGLLTSLLTMVL